MTWAVLVRGIPHSLLLMVVLVPVAAAQPPSDPLGELIAQQAAAPGYPGAAGRLGMYYHAHEQYAEALPWYEHAQALAPDRWRWPYLAGLSLMEAARPEDALALLAEALALAPEQEAVAVLYAQVLLSLGRLEAADEMLAQAMVQHQDSAALLAEEGLLRLAQRRYGDSVSRLRRALELQPDASRLQHPLASALRASGDRQGAREALSAAGKQSPRFDDPAGDEMRSLSQSYAFYMSQGLLAAANGDLPAARELLERALAASPDNPTVGVNYARVLESGGDVAGARAALQRVLQANPGHAPAWRNLGVLAELQAQDAQALESYRTAVELDPEDFRARLLAGSAALRLREMSQAAEQFAAASRLKPERDELLMSQAVAQWAVSCPNAIDTALQLVQRRPEDPAALLLYIRLASTCADAPPQARANALNAARNLSQLYPGPVLKISLAMAEAASGAFEQAAVLHESATQSLVPELTADQQKSLAALLERYRAGQAADQPFVLNEQVLNPPRLTPADRR
ncbi:MAG: tetratricopeptide repeat protein [Pseudomonadota bacterium]